MKLLGVRADPLSLVRRRGGARVDATSAAVAAPPADSVGFLGLAEADLTPQVAAAIGNLVAEIEELRQEVGRLKARLNEAEGLADRDSLTPLLNRRAFMRELRRVLTFAERYGAPASLIYLDLDGFKAVNDRFGHAAGDAALQTVAERLLTNVRDSDVVGRLGGDEFGVILVQADVGAATAKAESLVSLIEGEPAACGEWLTPLKVSYGVRRLRATDTAERALAAADAAMYARKRAG